MLHSHNRCFDFPLTAPCCNISNSNYLKDPCLNIPKDRCFLIGRVLQLYTMEHSTISQILALINLCTLLSSFVSVPGYCISNDPAVPAEEVYKQYSTPFGSCRPIRGVFHKTLIMKVQFTVY